MIGAEPYPVEPWTISENEIDLERLAEAESIFALSNGHIGLRGNLDEGEPHGVPGSYLNGFFETIPLPYAEGGFGYPTEGQTLLNVTNGKLLRLLVGDEPFDIRYGTLHHHTRQLDLRAGVLRREAEWSSPAGQTVRIRSTRLVSFVQRSIAAVRFEVEALDGPVRITVQSNLVANEPIPEGSDDVRTAKALRAPLVSEYFTSNGNGVELGHRTTSSGLRMAAAIDHVVDGPDGTVTDTEVEPDLARVTISTQLEPGQTLSIVKFIAYGWSAERSMPAVRDQVDAAMSAAKRVGWDGIVAGQRGYLDDVWATADVEIGGDPHLQQAVRYGIFQQVQAAARAEVRAIPAKGLTARGYDGHTFWDMDTYTLSVLTYIAPAAARDALLWRHATLPAARSRAEELGLQGATFAWRTIRGEECSGYWPAGTAAFHINAAVADAVRRYVTATDDVDFESGPGIELLVETARMWRSLGHHDTEGNFRIDGVTGPDEYSAVVDNNTFTNLMAARNLRCAADCVERYPDRAVELGVDDDTLSSWRAAAGAMVIPFDAELGVTAQAEGFTRYRKWDFAGTDPADYPLLMNVPYYRLYSSQVAKQADLVMALYACGDGFTAEQKQRDFAYYEAITVRDSSLSAAIQAIVAVEVGHMDLAYEYFRETAFVDLRNRAGNTADGLHLASLAGSWMVAVNGFGGMRDQGDQLCFAPRLPAAMDRLTFRLGYRGRQLRVELRPDAAAYELRSGAPLDIVEHGEIVTLTAGEPLVRPYPPFDPPPPVSPPPGRDAFGTGVGVEVVDSRN